jgi:hypothetical protein
VYAVVKCYQSGYKAVINANVTGIGTSKTSTLPKLVKDNIRGGKKASVHSCFGETQAFHRVQNSDDAQDYFTDSYIFGTTSNFELHCTNKKLSIS